MILYLDPNNKIIAYNDILSPEEEDVYINGTDVIRYEGDFDFLNIPHKEGKDSILYLSDTGEIEVHYDDIPEPEQEGSAEDIIWDSMANAIMEGVNDV